MKKSLLFFVLFVALVGLSSQITRAENEQTTPISSSPEIIEKNGFHLARYKSDRPVKALGLVNGMLLASFSETEHAWFFKHAFVPVVGSNAAKTLGYDSVQTATSLLGLPKKSACTKFKDAIGAVSVTETKTLCLRSSTGGDFTLNLLPATKDKPVPIGFGKQPLVEKTRVSWIGVDGNLYVAYLHPEFFTDDVKAHKSKTNSTVFLLRNGLRYSVPNEQTYYTWFDSFSAVTVLDAKKLATYPLLTKATYKPNTLLQFDGAPEIYVYQPANDPFLQYGKGTKILTDAKDKFVIQDPKKKTATIDIPKRPELLRHVASITDLENTFGSTWKKRVRTLDPALKSSFTISDKDFVATTDLVFE